MKTTLDDIVRQGGVRLLCSGLHHLQAADQSAGRKLADDVGMPLAATRPGRAPGWLPSASALPVRLSLTIFFKLASAAAAQTGLPVCVLVIEPGGNWSMISSRPITAESGSELLMPLPQQITSGVTP